MNLKNKIIAVLSTVVLLSACIIGAVVALGADYPTVDKLFSGNNVTFTTEATDGKTPEKGLLLTADKAGASAEFKLDLSEKLQIDLKTLGESVPRFSIKLTDSLGQEFIIGSIAKALYDNVYVELDGERGGIYYFSEKWDTVTGYTAGYNDMKQEYTQFYRFYSKEDRNSEENPVTADADCLHLQFDPATMQVGIKRYAADGYITVWDLSEQINDGHDIGSSIDYFGDYTFEIVFDEIVNNNGQILIYSLNGYDFSKANLDADDPTMSISVPVTAKAVKNQNYIFPEGVCKTLDGVFTDGIVTKIGTRGLSQYTPSADSPFTITYEYGDFKRNVTIPVVSSVSGGPAAADIPSSVGQNQRIELSDGKISTNLSYYGAPLTASVTVKDSDGETVALAGGSFLASKVGTYTVTYTALDGAFNKTYSIAVSASDVGVNYPVFANVYRINDRITITPAKIWQNGSANDASSVIKYPSGKTASAGELILDETGYYTVVHTYTADGSEKTYEQQILVKMASEDLFTGPSSVDVSYGTVTGNNDFSGVKLTFNGDKQVSYEKVIDLSDNSFDSKTNTGDILLELVAQPHAIGTADMEQIYIEFTDVDDPTNTMSIKLAYYSYSHTVTKIHAKGPGQEYTARRANGEYTSVMDAGFNARHSFIQTVRYGTGSLEGTFDSYTLKLYYDSEENALYANPEWDTGNYLVLDFDDPSAFSTNPWSGFAGGKVNMSIRVAGVSSSADLFILNIDGTQLDGEMFTDVKAPIITPSIETAPLAAVNKPYNFIPFDAIDLDSGVSETWWEIYDESGNKISTSGSSFTPTQTGQYTIRLCAKDYFGNIAAKDMIVRTIDYVAGVSLTIEGEIPKTAIYGQYVELPKFTVSGGAGAITTVIKVTKDGEAVPVNNNMFLISEEGDYIVTYEATDFIGGVNTKSFFVKASMGKKPSIDETQIKLPVAFIHGDEYIFEDYKASFFAGVGATEEFIKARITVEDAAGVRELTGLAYTPIVTSADTAVDEIKVTFTFAKEGCESLVITKSIKAVYPKAETGFMSKYFLLQNGTALANTNGIAFASNSGNMKIEYIRPLSTRNLSIVFATEGSVTKALDNSEIAALKAALVGTGKQFATEAELDAELLESGIEYSGSRYYKTTRFYFRESAIKLQSYSQIAITLRDVNDPTNQVTVTYKRDGQNFISSVCGTQMTATLNTEKEFKFGYDGASNTVTDINNTKLGSFTLTDSGDVFAGFGDSVYVTVEVQGITGDCSMIFKSISNHTFNNGSADYIDPVMWLNGNIGGRYDIGTTLTIPTASGYDVLNGIDTPTVSITAPDGTLLLTDAPADIEYRLTIGQYGYYYVVYTATDGAGRQISIRKSLLVLDDRTPELIFGGNAIPEIAKVGEKITLPTYEISDNDVNGVSVSVTLRKPGGLYDMVKGDSVTFDKAGIYTVNYFVIDADNNTNVYSYTITVIE